jgi:hypothetical protein
MLSSPSSLRFLALHKKEEEEGDDIVVAVAFSATLSYCNAAPQEKEIGDGSKVVVAFFFLFFLATQKRTNKTNKQEKRKDAYLGLVWVPLQLHSHNSRLAPARRLWSSSDGLRVGGGRGW